MATLKRRLNRKSASGFDVMHLETESSIVLRSGASDGATVESSLVALEANTHATNKPTTATAAQAGPNATVTVVSGVTTKDNGHVDKVTTQKVVIPAAPANMKGASASAAGSAGYVPAPAAGATSKFLRGDGTWAAPADTKYTHPNDGKNTGSFGPTANASLAHHGTFVVPYLTVNAAGHVTAAGNRTMTMPGPAVSYAATQPTDQVEGDLWYEPLND